MLESAKVASCATIVPALLLGLFAASAAEKESPLSGLLSGPKGFRLEMSLSETSASSAVISFRELISEQRVPRRARRLYRQALKLDQKGKTQLAMDKLNDALDLAPNYFQAHSALAVGYLKAGSLDQAEHHLSVAQRLNHDYLPAREIKALTFFARGQFQEAARALEDLLKLAPARESIHYSLGLVLLKLGDEVQASSHLQRAEELHKKHRLDWPSALQALRSFQSPVSDGIIHPNFR